MCSPQTPAVPPATATSSPHSPHSRRSSLRRVVVFSMVLALGGTTAGCTSPPPTLAATPTSAAAGEHLTLQTHPTSLALGSVPNLVTHTDVDNDPQDARFVTTFAVGPVPDYATAASELVDQATQRYVLTRQEALRADPGASSQLRIVSDLAAAGGDMLGLTTTSTTSIAQGTGSTSETSVTVYVRVPDSGGAARGGARDVLTSPELLTSEGAVSLRAAVLAFLRVHAELADPVQLTAAAAASAGIGDDVRLRPDGSADLVLAQDNGLTYPVAGPSTLRIPAADLTPWLSPDGLAVRQQLVSSRAFVGLPAPVTPAATPVVTPTSSATTQGTAPVDCRRVKCIALTFDDGPGSYTARLLDELAAARVHATFMVVGRNAATAPGLVRREVAEGHEVGNHTWDHQDLSKLTAAQVDDELDRADAAIAAAVGGGFHPALVRPPYGALNSVVRSDLARREKAAILWNVDTEDWKNKNSVTTTNRALQGARPGAIVLMHDIHPTTVAAVPGLVAQLRAEGYTFVTVSQLLGTQLKPGKGYGGGSSAR